MLVFCLVMSIVSAADFTESYFKFQLTPELDLEKISSIVSIDNVRDGEVFAYASDRQLEEFRNLGIDFEILPRPSTLIVPEMYTFEKGVWDFDTYPTYDTYVSMMESFAVAFPNLCVIDTAGSTVEGRKILFAKISDNVNTEEDEPEVMYTSTIHGDETTGFVLMLHLIDYLLNNYGTDSLVTRLIDSCEIYINPAANPDGTYAGGNSTVYGATRYNANGYDLNRNFPDPDDGPNPNGPTQTETQVMMNYAEAHSFVISSNLHGGSEVINYPWDTWSRLHTDDTWWVYISHQFADTAQYYSPSGYLSGFNDGITNGYDWYSISGGRQDYMNYYHGCREMTYEISNTKLLSQSLLPDWWDYNRQSFLNYFENALYGIRGVVTDANSGLPVYAAVVLDGHDSDADSSMIFTDPDVGDYHRMINPGTYTVIVSAPGYYPDTASITVNNYSHTIRNDVSLQPLPTDPDLYVLAHNLSSVQPGEAHKDFTLTLQNVSAGIVYNPRCSLYTADSYISITRDTADYPSIGALGGTAASLTDFQLDVDPGCPLNHTVLINAYLTADGGYSQTRQFEFVVGQTVENFESGSFATMGWSTIGYGFWSIVTESPYEGQYCAKSGSISGGQYTQLAITVNVSEAGYLKFKYKVSSASGDYLRFYKDAVYVTGWTGEVDWTEYSEYIEAGEHTFWWRYTKNSTGTSGSDCGWIDLVEFPPLAPEFSIATASLPDWTAGYTFSEQLTADGGSGTLVWSDNDGGLTGSGLTISTDGLVSGIPLSDGTISFEARVEDQGGHIDTKTYVFDIAPALDITTETLTDAEVSVPYSALISATGGTGTLTFTDKNGDLAPYGLALASDGTLSGTPTTSGQVEFTVNVSDAVGASYEKNLSLSIAGDCVCGDSDNNGSVDILDIILLIDYKYKEGDPPLYMECSDVNNDTDVNILDIIDLIDFKFKSGPAPACGSAK